MKPKFIFKLYLHALGSTRNVLVRHKTAYNKHTTIYRYLLKRNKRNQNISCLA